MKLVKPKFEILEQAPGLEGIEKQIELAGRTCYHSQNRITEDSAKKFVDMMVKSGHGAMLEHGTVYLAIPMTTHYSGFVWMYKESPYCKVNECNEMIFTDKFGNKVAAWCVTTNLRFLVENDLLNDLECLCEPTKYHERRVTVRFTMDRIGSQSFCRHRVFSFAQESTRYCNYSKDKFNNEIKFIIPCWCNLQEGRYTWWNNDWCDAENMKILKHDNYDEIDTMLHLFNFAELTYRDLTGKGWTAQKARTVLPVGLATEIVMTGFVSDWEHFFKLRDDAHAHPQAQELAKPLHEDFIKKGYIDDEHKIA